MRWELAQAVGSILLVWWAIYASYVVENKYNG